MSDTNGTPPAEGQPQYPQPQYPPPRFQAPPPPSYPPPLLPPQPVVQYPPPQYRQPQPQPQPQPQYAQPHFPQPQDPQQYRPPAAFQQKPDHTTRNVLIAVFGSLGALMIAGLVVIVVVAASVLSNAGPILADDPVIPDPYVTSTPEPEPSISADPLEPDPIVPDPVPSETTVPQPEQSGDPFANAQELKFKSGENWLSRPASKNITRFNDKYDLPENWLKSIDRLPDGLGIVITNDKELNCGWTLVYQPDSQVGGCYRPEYGKTLFMYWGKNALPQMKELVLLHELSHFVQEWDHFDAVTSAYQSDVSQSDVTKIIETDATCRVYDEWGYDKYRYLDDSTSSPCGGTDWRPDWMEAKFVKFGVTIEDW